MNTETFERVDEPADMEILQIQSAGISKLFQQGIPTNDKEEASLSDKWSSKRQNEREKLFVQGPALIKLLIKLSEDKFNRKEHNRYE